jgi:hypothetical protein
MIPISAEVPELIRAGLHKGLRDAVAKLYGVLASSQLDTASQERFEKGLQKAVEAYMAALNVLQRKS